jgi:hypothetical protein
VRIDLSLRHHEILVVVTLERKCKCEPPSLMSWNELRRRAILMNNEQSPAPPMLRIKASSITALLLLKRSSCLFLEGLALINISLHHQQYKRLKSWAQNHFHYFYQTSCRRHTNKTLQITPPRSPLELSMHLILRHKTPLTFSLHWKVKQPKTTRAP